jgi:hypothetical protein
LGDAVLKLVASDALDSEGEFADRSLHATGLPAG